MVNYLGVDWGEKRIGLALANDENLLATPFKVIESVSGLLKIIEDEQINELVIGLPQKMKTGGVDNIKFKNFIIILEKKIVNKKIEINFIDERLSSVQADSLRIGKIKTSRDCISAMIILQSYLDKKYAQN
jgi:putative holliday junction resolvase